MPCNPLETLWVLRPWQFLARHVEFAIPNSASCLRAKIAPIRALRPWQFPTQFGCKFRGCKARVRIHSQPQSPSLAELASLAIPNLISAISCLARNCQGRNPLTSEKGFKQSVRCKFPATNRMRVRKTPQKIFFLFFPK